MDTPGTSNQDAWRTTIVRMESTTRRYSTELARISREFHRPVTSGVVSQQPPDMPGSVDMATSTNHDVSSTNTIVPMESTTHRNNTQLASISSEVDGLDNLGIVSQNQDLDRQAQRFGDSPAPLDRIEFYHQLIHRTHQANTGTSEASPTRAETFLQSLPPLSLTDLPHDNKDCPICMEPYLAAQHNESPVRLPCTHVMGKDCLQSWLNSSNLNRNNNTCPMCRAVLFKRDMAALAHQLRTNTTNTMLDRGWDVDRQRGPRRLDGLPSQYPGDSEVGAVVGRPQRTRAPTLEELNEENAALREDLARLQATSDVRRESLNHASAALRDRWARVRDTAGARPEQLDGSDAALRDLPRVEHVRMVQHDRPDEATVAERERLLGDMDRVSAHYTMLTSGAFATRRIVYSGARRERRGAM
ncbi:MAG: hypothetical protein Q9161_000475 [Pseudevernia consocians]